ncbi:MAG TPA: hypothetical protein VIO95_02015 [Mycobacterium sp.]
MHAATTRSIIAGAGLAAIGLAFWPQDTTHVAQPGIPTVHRDVALVDATSALLGAEGTFDNALWNDVLGPTGAEEQLYSTLASAIGASQATTLLDATGANPIFSGVFDGAESRGFEGLFLNTLAAEDQINQALGITATASQTQLDSVFNTDFVPIPAAAHITAAQLEAAVGTSSFDTDLATIANADYTLAAADFQGFLTNLLSDTSGLGSLGAVFTDLGNSFSDLSNLSGDLSTILTDIGNLGLGGLI